MEMDSYVLTAIIVLGSAFMAVFGLLVVRKLIDLQHLQPTHEVGGYLLSVVGTLYAVLLGLIVVDALGKFQIARDIAAHEANALMDIFILAESLPQEDQKLVRQLCFDYAEEVMHVEWPLMDQGQFSQNARRILVRLSKSLSHFEPVTENQKAVYPLLMTQSSELWDNRRMRINMVTHGVPAIEWLVLIVGAVVTVFFTYFFGLENLKLQVCMTIMVALLISLNLVLVLIFGYPYSGSVAICPDSFQLVQDVFEGKLGLAPANQSNHGRL